MSALDRPVNGLKTEQWRIDEIRRMRQDGSDYRYICSAMNVSRKTVRRYCADLPAPEVRPFTNSDRQKYLESWKPVGDFLNGWPEDGEPLREDGDERK